MIACYGRGRGPRVITPRDRGLIGSYLRTVLRAREEDLLSSYRLPVRTIERFRFEMARDCARQLQWW